MGNNVNSVKKLYSVLVKILGGFILAIGIIVVQVGFKGRMDFFVKMLTAFAGIGLLGLGSWMIRVSKEMVQLSAGELMKKDTRRPILYLRSFVDDKVTSQVVNVSSTMPFSASSEEEQLADALNRVGPVIAIGEPGEAKPKLGAARMYVSHAEWKEKVNELMERASLVVMRAGNTEGFWWEVQNGITRLMPQKIVFLIPKDSNTSNYFYNRISENLRRPIPPFDVNKNERLYSIRGLLYFKEDWTPQYVKLKRPNIFRMSMSKPLISWLHGSMEPIFKNAGIPYKPLPLNIVSTLFFSFVIGCVLFSLILIMVLLSGGSL